MKNAAKVNNNSPPYLFQHYNVKSYYNTTSPASKGLARLLNLLIEALNERARLPKYIIMIPDKDIIIETKCFGFGTSYILWSAVYFLIKQMEIFLSRCQIDWIDKNPGAVIEPDFPVIIWIRMLKRPSKLWLLGQGKALRLKVKFNSVLEEWLFEGLSNL